MSGLGCRRKSDGHVSGRVLRSRGCVRFLDFEGPVLVMP
jgi:hypothetical protein